MGNQLTFAEGFSSRSNSENFKTFDWDKALDILLNLIKDKGSNIVVDAGLNGDLNYTSGTIYNNSELVSNSYTYLKSNWATPVMVVYELHEGDYVQTQTIPCYFNNDEKHYDESSKWEQSHLDKFKIEFDKLPKTISL